MEAKDQKNDVESMRTLYGEKEKKNNVLIGSEHNGVQVQKINVRFPYQSPLSWSRQKCMSNSRLRSSTVTLDMAEGTGAEAVIKPETEP